MMVSDQFSPPSWRIIAAFLISPLVAAVTLACIQPLYAGLPSMIERIYRTAIAYSMYGAYPSTILLGLPTFLLLRSKILASPRNCTISGACIAALPWLALSLISPPDSAFSGGHVTVINGHKTIWGWIELAELLVEIGAFGAFAGFVFWLVVSVGTHKPIKAPT